MKKVLFVAMLCTLWAHAQYTVKDGSELLNLRKVAQEKVYVHHSAPVIFSGEYLYYKIYCQNTQTNRLSRISSMAYVNLIDSQGQVVFEHKIKLEKGMGTGDFFVNTTVPSGNYKLVAYTQWMKNGGVDQLFQDDVTIINPYMVDQSALLPEQAEAASQAVPAFEPSGQDLLEVQLGQSTLSNRTKATLQLRNYKGNLGHGNYSILVRKKDGLGERPNMSAATYANAYLNADKTIKQGVGDAIFLPEQRGELFFGQLTDAAGNAAVDKTVIVSIPGKEHLLKSAITDETGHFYTYIRKDYKNPSSIVQVLEEGDYTVDLKKQKGLDFSQLEFGSFLLDENQGDAIRQRSVYNQIENGFFSVKPDSILPKEEIDVFDGGIPEVFVLDEYTRFPTLEETLIEILNTVGYRNGGKGNDYIRVAQEFEKFNEPYNDYQAIVLIDGVFIPNHESIKEFDARNIKTIKVLRDELALGSTPYQGLVAIETFDGDFYETYTNKNSVSSALELPMPRKNYFRQQFNTVDGSESNIPDYRNVLLWEPFVNLDGTELQFEFFTSDVSGEFEIILEGFTSYGKPVSLRKTIAVN
ncbi:hypothetical protein ABV409_09360 [Flagellimonas sp. DF-77]|uniref:hypothetical protein n=1 Tax=Flagellimonas algarum TaxID=3230298 RepID=UPI00339B8BE6